MPKTITYRGKVCKVLKETWASRSNDPAVKKSFLTEEFGWVIDMDCEKVGADGQGDTQNP